jgi:hypothetical protein
MGDWEVLFNGGGHAAPNPWSAIIYRSRDFSCESHGNKLCTLSRCAPLYLKMMIKP